MDTSSLLLGLRVVLSLACVLGLLWYIGRRMSASPSGRRRAATALTVVGRQSLGGKSGLALVEVSGRRLLLGVSEHGVNLLTELGTDPEDDTEPDGAATGSSAAERVELDPASLERLITDVPSDLSSLELEPAEHRPVPTSRLSPLPTESTPARPTESTPALPTLSTPAARKPAVPKPRNPLEGSILDATTWRRAVVAVQERTIRR